MMFYKYYDDPKFGEIMKEFDKVLRMMKCENPAKHEWIKQELYIIMNGEHFTEDLLKEAYKCMENDDGSQAPKWSVAETTSVADQYNIKFEGFDKYDWNYVMNMMYSDYCLVLKENLMNYVNMANKFLHDKDAPKGKALKYYFAMQYDKKSC